jgi:DNA polymerase-4
MALLGLSYPGHALCNALTKSNGRATPVSVVRHILHVDLDAFFVAVEQVRDPSLLGKAVIVGGDPSGRGVVSTASYEARAFGAYSGMALRTAKRLAPQAIFLRGDFAAYERASRAFHAIIDDCSPLVESGGLDEAYVDITGCEAIVGTPPEAAATIRGRIRAELDLPASVGIASCKLVAKVASDAAKPDGVLAVVPGAEAAFLAPLPLRALPMLGPTMERRLVRLGLSTLGQLASMPAATLKGLFGSQGALIAQRCRGIDPSPVAGGAEAKSISREGTFASDVVDVAHLRAVLRGFSESVGSQLRGQRKRARTVSLKLRYEDFSTISRSLTLKLPANSNEAIFEAADLLLGRLRSVERRPVRLIGVGTSNLVADAIQLTLGGSKEAEQESISAAFDHMRDKYGSRSLQTGRTAFDPATRDEKWGFDKRTGLSTQMK